jgi:hypothetical protein
MRITAPVFCLAISLIATPSFAQVGKPGAPESQPLADQPASKDALAESKSLNLGLGFGSSVERPLLPLAPIEKDQVQLSWRPGGKWGINLNLTSRDANEVLPREELAAGAYYQVTPRFRFGGGVTVKGDSLTESLSKPGANFKDEVSEATVRIESAFSF